MIPRFVNLSHNFLSALLFLFFYLAEETKQLVDNLSGHGVLFAIFNVDTTDDFNATLRHIYNSAMRSKLTMNFVVVCRPACVRKVLHIVSILFYSNVGLNIFYFI